MAKYLVLWSHIKSFRFELFGRQIPSFEHVAFRPTATSTFISMDLTFPLFLPTLCSRLGFLFIYFLIITLVFVKSTRLG